MSRRESMVDFIDGEAPSADVVGGLRIRGADLSRVRPTRWLYEGRLPMGYLSLLLGAEGVGKGTAAAYLIARATQGELPGDSFGTPVRVLVIGDEDGFDSVLIPRLLAAGADLNMIDVLEEDNGEFLDIGRDAGKLRDLIAARGYGLAYFDALLDVLGVNVDDWRAKQVREALRPLRRIAQELDVCMLATLHPNKGSRSNFRDLVSGSFAFNASSRSSLLLAEHPEDGERRILVRGKGNLSAPPPGIEFRIVGEKLQINGFTFDVPKVVDLQITEIGIDDVLKGDRSAPVRKTLAEEIHALGTGEIQTRSEIARMLNRESDDRSVGRALDQLQADEKWEKVDRGQWRRFGIGPSKEVPMSKGVGGGTG